MSVFLSLDRYDKVAVDTETNGLAHQSRPVGCSITCPDGEKRYFRWGHEAGGNNCSLAEFIRWANDEFSDHDRQVIMHNAGFDLRKLRQVGVKINGIVEDTGIIYALLNEYEPSFKLDDLAQKYLGHGKSNTALIDWCADHFGGARTHRAQAGNYWRAPGDIVEPYAIGDTDDTLALYDLKRHEIDRQNLADVYQDEVMLIPVLVRMYMAGVRVDVATAEKTQRDFKRRYREAEVEWDRISGGFKFSERNKMIALFDRLGIAYPRNPPTEAMKRKGITIGNPRLDKDFLDSLDEDVHPVGGLIRKMRQYTHYADTFIQSYLLDNVGNDGFIHPQFHQVKSEWGGTVTGRFSSAGGLNAQNIPARDKELAAVIRGMFIPASEDHQWLKVDYSQIEYRYLAHYAGGKLRRAYCENPDIDFHDMVAEMTGLERKAAKNINFGILYGMGVAKTALKLGVSPEEAQDLLDQYNARVPEAKKLYNSAMNRASVRGYIITWGGRINRFQQVGERRKKYIGTHKALNKLLQGSAADLTKKAMIRVDQLIDWDSTVMHLTVHDELDFSVLKGEEGIRTARLIKQAMEDYNLTVPIKAEAELGPDWGHCEKLRAA